eukprot:CAMPEP_0180538938 /NCGR_PEP_ID=MMETSP1036_2-20121128/66622_1 /TAXON_ID=632150 /ORGANISM="Azadinium spinosum, Strain 3D9" /LENGTH=53 /DNA_ID=CAMNT_0022553645 /DNA_START=10 /DNA_END=168 /DNA_ORIENTATION=+
MTWAEPTRSASDTVSTPPPPHAHLAGCSSPDDAEFGKEEAEARARSGETSSGG